MKFRIRPTTNSTAPTMMPASAMLFLNPACFDLLKAMMLTTMPTRLQKIASTRPTMPIVRPGSWAGGPPYWGAP